MSHGFSRFGPPSARERFHRQTRPSGSLAMLLPTILATLFLFVVVITLNKASSMTRGGKLVRLMNVDDVFPTQLDVEQNRKKEFWELTVPPPSPDAVLSAQAGDGLAQSKEGLTLDGPNGFYLPPTPEVIGLRPETIPGFEPTIVPTTRTTAPTRQHIIETPEILLPPVAPDTSLPVGPSTP